MYLNQVHVLALLPSRADLRVGLVLRAEYSPSTLHGTENQP